MASQAVVLWHESLALSGLYSALQHGPCSTLAMSRGRAAVAIALCGLSAQLHIVHWQHQFDAVSFLPGVSHRWPPRWPWMQERLLLNIAGMRSNTCWGWRAGTATSCVARHP